MSENKKKPRHFSLRIRLIATVLVCWTVPVLLVWLVLGTLSQQSLRVRLDATLSDNASFAATQTMSTLDNVIELSRRTSTDNVFYEQYKYFPGEEYRVMRYKATLESLRSTLVRSSAVLLATMTYYDDPDTVVSFIQPPNNAGIRAEHYRQTDHDGIMAVAAKSGSYIAFYQQEDRLYVIRNILAPDAYTPFATLAIRLDLNTLAAPFSHMGLEEVGYTIRIANYLDEHPLYWPYETAFLDALQTGQGRLWHQGDMAYNARMYRDSDYTFAFQVAVNYTENFPELQYLRIVSGFLGLGVIPLLIYVFLFLHKQVNLPIQALTKLAGQLSREEFGRQVDALSNSKEMDYLISAFNQMSMRLKELFEKVYQEEIMLRDAKIEALQSQINPHFFNNTLELINWQARRTGDQKISRMVESLGTLVGAGLNRFENPLVSLDEEMDSVDAYIYITSMRYGKRLRVDYEIDDALLTELVPRLSIQPILENAVLHGIENAQEARLTVRAYRKVGVDSRLRMMIEITNSGTLTPEDKQAVDAIFCTGQGKIDNSGARRLGLANVYQRLQLLYHDPAALSYRFDEISTTFVLSIVIDKDDSVTSDREV